MKKPARRSRLCLAAGVARTGAKRSFSGMVADTFALVKKESPAKARCIHSRKVKCL
jgi:hypothetical protein